jgi:hypothetical protein
MMLKYMFQINIFDIKIDIILLNIEYLRFTRFNACFIKFQF